MADHGVAEVPGRRILVVAPQPFYEDRGTPIAVRQVLQALGELGRSVDLLTFPIGTDVGIPGLRIFRSANPFGFERVPIGLSFRKVILDVPLGVGAAPHRRPRDGTAAFTRWRKRPSRPRCSPATTAFRCCTTCSRAWPSSSPGSTPAPVLRRAVP